MLVQVVLLDDPSWAQPIAGGRAVTPRYVMVVDELPMTVTGKVCRVEMRAKTAQRLGRPDATAQRRLRGRLAALDGP